MADVNGGVNLGVIENERSGTVDNNYAGYVALADVQTITVYVGVPQVSFDF